MTNSESEIGLEAETNRYHLILFQTSGDILYRGLARKINKLLDESVDTEYKTNEIDIWLESFGGDAHAAYKMSLDLRHRCRTLRAVVPDYAKSAATLLVLGADEIYMSHIAELGPLDAQIEHPDKERTILSALDVANSLESLGRISLALSYEYADFCVELMDLPRSDALHAVLDYMAQFMQPAIGKLDPHRIHQATNLLGVASDYGERMLAKRNISPEKRLNRQESQNLVKKLVRDYGDHGFIISREEANHSLGLPVKNAEDHPRWLNIRAIHGEFREGNRSLVKIIRDTQFDPEPIEKGPIDEQDKAPVESGDNGAEPNHAPSPV